MAQPVDQVTQYINEAQLWNEEMLALRNILLDCDLTEAWKWRAPCYTHGGKNIAIIGPFKANLTLSFFKGSLLSDPNDLLKKPGENSQSGRILTFTSVEEVNQLSNQIKELVDQAIQIEKSGKKVEKKASNNLDLPEELLDLFKVDKALEEAFFALTPGRQRGYAIYFNGAKQAKSRINRIQNYVSRILDGKGFHDCVCGHTKKPPTCDGSHKFH